MNLNVENELWGKTLISVYRFLPAIADAIDNIIKKKTINSLFYNANKYLSTYELANKVIELTERKVKIINIKVVLEKAISKLNATDQKILMLYYVDGVKYLDVIKLLKISTRTFFRRKDIAIKNLGKELEILGYNSEKLKKYLFNENWIMNYYNQNALAYMGHFKTDSNAQNYKLLKNVVSELNNPIKYNYDFYKFSS